MTEKEFVDHFKETVGHADIVEIACNMKRLSTEYGWKQDEIAELYKQCTQKRCTPNYVSMLQAIARFHPDVHVAMRNHGLSIKSALLIKEKKWSLEIQQLFIKDLISSARGGNINKVGRKLIRERERAARTESEIREFLRSLLKKEQPGQVHRLARDFLAFIDGSIDDARMEHKLRTALSAT